MYPVYVYDASVRRKRYVGSRPRLGSRTGDVATDAKALEAQKEREFSQRGYRRQSGTWSEYAARWLEVKHGEGTRRPTGRTRRHNDDALKPFLSEFGDRRLWDLIPRDQALDWAHNHTWQVRAVSAMFNDALNEGLIVANPFANRQQAQSRGRRDIAPIIEEELEQLGEIALEHWGPGEYGPRCRAWIMMAGWVGCRPGEMWRLTVDDLDLKGGMVRFHRIKGQRQSEWVVLPAPARDALLAAVVPLRGLVFTTQRGKPMDKGAARYYWDPVRTLFVSKLSDVRRRELLAGRPNLDLYELRHMCASMLADRGCSALEIAQQLGNSPEVCERVYIHAHRDRVNERLRAAFGQRVHQLRPVDGMQQGSESA